MVTKRLILAVAGSGKTTLIIESLNLEERYLIVTYTINNFNTIKRRIISKFGFFPKNITVLKFFEFAYSFCTKPFLLFKYSLKGICFEKTPDYTNYFKISDEQRYLTKNNLIYHNRISKFLEINETISLIIDKLEKFYDYFIIDEFQDLGGHDFNLIMQLAKSNINLLFVGDFYQHTYSTSNDGQTNKKLYVNIDKYIEEIESHNINVDTQTLIGSHRCSPTICKFISDNLNIEIESKREDETTIHIVDNIKDIPHIIEDNSIVKLLYNNSSEQSFFAKNWGECKGEDDYSHTCVILNKSTTQNLKKNKLNDLKPSTKNKLYVAISRTKGDCFIVKH